MSDSAFPLLGIVRTEVQKLGAIQFRQMHDKLRIGERGKHEIMLKVTRAEMELDEFWIESCRELSDIMRACDDAPSFLGKSGFYSSFLAKVFLGEVIVLAHIPPGFFPYDVIEMMCGDPFGGAFCRYL